jgi:hypothetical protein
LVWFASASLELGLYKEEAISVAIKKYGVNAVVIEIIDYRCCGERIINIRKFADGERGQASRKLVLLDLGWRPIGSIRIWKQREESSLQDFD